MAEVRLQNVSKTFGSEIALDDVSMTIPNGAFVVLLGPTGAGKTTTLRLVSGLDAPDSGEIFRRRFGDYESPRELIKELPKKI